MARAVQHQRAVAGDGVVGEPDDVEAGVAQEQRGASRQAAGRGRIQHLDPHAIARRGAQVAAAGRRGTAVVTRPPGERGARQQQGHDDAGAGPPQSSWFHRLAVSG
jgi:hypothetical protein